MAELDLIFRFPLDCVLRDRVFTTVRINANSKQVRNDLYSPIYWHSLNITRGRTWEKLCVHSSACTIRASWVLFTQWPYSARRAYDRSVSARVCERREDNAVRAETTCPVAARRGAECVNTSSAHRRKTIAETGRRMG